MIHILKCKPIKPSIISRIIMWHQGTNYSHYAIRLFDGCFTDVYHASSNGVTVEPEYKFLRKYEIVSSHRLSDGYDTILAKKLLRKHIGSGYGYLQILGLLFNVGWFINGASRVICCEYVLRFLNDFFGANISKIDGYDLNDTAFQIKRFER